MAKRYVLSDEIPDLINAEQVKDLIRQYLGHGVSYVTFRQMVESGVIPSRLHPFRDASKFGSRRYHWPEVRRAIELRTIPVADVLAQKQKAPAATGALSA